MDNTLNNTNKKANKRKVREKKAKTTAYVYIDGANMFYTQRKLGWFFDFKKIKKYLNENWDILRIKYYTGVKTEDPKMNSFLKYLDKVGIEPITKPLKQIRNGKGIIYKSNFDVEMTIDMLLERSSYDTCILLSGDSDFEALVKKLQDFGKKIVVYSSRKTISWELKLAANDYFFFEDLKKELGRSS